MNILDINTLPVLTLNISGREGTPTGAWVINQENKEKIQIEAEDISYTVNGELVITLIDDDFISTIESNTTLSIIVFDLETPLYRDIAKFRGQLDSVELYDQYDHSDYYVYSEEDED